MAVFALVPAHMPLYYLRLYNKVCITRHAYYIGLYDRGEIVGANTGVSHYVNYGPWHGHT